MGQTAHYTPQAQLEPNFGLLPVSHAQNQPNFIVSTPSNENATHIDIWDNCNILKINHEDEGAIGSYATKTVVNYGNSGGW